MSYSDYLLYIIHLSLTFQIFILSITNWPITNKIGSKNPLQRGIQFTQMKILAFFLKMVSRSVCRPKDVCSISAKLDTVDASRKYMTSIDVQVTWSKVKVKMLVFEKIFFAQYLNYLLTPL